MAEMPSPLLCLNSSSRRSSCLDWADRNPNASSCRFDRGEYHGKALDVVVAPSHGNMGRVVERLKEVPQRAGDARMCRLGDLFLSRVYLGHEAFGLSHQFSLDVAISIPSRTSPRADRAPLRFPRSVSSFCAPASPIGEPQTTAHFEERICGRGAAVPAPIWVVLFAVNANGVAAGKEPRLVERVNGHIEQQ